MARKLRIIRNVNRLLARIDAAWNGITDSMQILNYFAYGSNLHPLRLAERVPSSRLVMVAALHNHRLVFHKRGKDGSGKCDCVYTGASEDRVLGAVYQFARREKPMLDACEGDGYATHEVELVCGNRRTTAYTYRAKAGYCDPTLTPFDWYKALVLHGARFHRFDPAYVKHVDSIPFVTDRNRARAAKHHRLLSRIGEHGLARGSGEGAANATA